MPFRKIFAGLALSLLIVGCASAPAPVARPAPAPAVPAPFAASLPIASGVAASPAHRRLAALIAEAQLGDLLAAPGPLTLFAPDDAALGRLDPASAAALARPEHRDVLIRLLGLHIVSGALTEAELRAQIAAGGGVARLTTIQGEAIVARIHGGALLLSDAANNAAYVVGPERRVANGIVHSVNGVLLPKADY